MGRGAGSLPTCMHRIVRCSTCSASFAPNAGPSSSSSSSRFSISRQSLMHVLRQLHLRDRLIRPLAPRNAAFEARQNDEFRARCRHVESLQAARQLPPGGQVFRITRLSALPLGKCSASKRRLQADRRPQSRPMSAGCETTLSLDMVYHSQQAVVGLLFSLPPNPPILWVASRMDPLDRCMCES